MRRSSASAVLLFLAFQGLYGLTSSGNVFRVPDEFETYFQVESLADSASLAVPQTLAIRETVVGQDGVAKSQPIFFGRFGRHGQPYAPYGPLTAILAVPHHLAARAVARVSGVRRGPLPAGRPWLVLVAGLTALVTSTAGALTVVGFFLAARASGCEERRAVGLSVLLGAATPIWTYAACLYSEAILACLLVWAAFLLIRAREGGTRSAAHVGGAAVLLLAAGLSKATALVLLPGFVVAAAADRTPRGRVRTALVLATAFAMACGVHLAWNTWRYGTPWQFGYDWTETITGGAPAPFDLSDLPRGLLVLLASPGKSLVLWAPPLLLALGIRRPDWEHHRGLLAGLAVSLGVGLLFYGTYFFPEGGYAHGPRHLVPLIPLLLLPAAFSAPFTARRAAWWACGAVGSLMALGSVSVSFLEDQGIGPNLARPRGQYYERVLDRPGKPWNRYNLSYVPFVSTVASGNWGLGGPPGSGVDFFALHLMRARRVLPDCRAAIPRALPWLLLSFWSALSAVGTAGLRREYKSASAPPPAAESHCLPGV